VPRAAQQIFKAQSKYKPSVYIAQRSLESLAMYKHRALQKYKLSPTYILFPSSFHRILQCRKRPFSPSSLHRQQSHPRLQPHYPTHLSANPSNLQIPGYHGQFSMATQPDPHIFGTVGGNRSTRRKPTQTRGERANSAQTVTRAGNQTQVPVAVRQQC